MSGGVTLVSNYKTLLAESGSQVFFLIELNPEIPMCLILDLSSGL